MSTFRDVTGKVPKSIMSLSDIKRRKILQDWFRAYIEELDQKTGRLSDEAVLEISNLLLEKAKEKAPDGSQNLDQYPTRRGQRPSERLGHPVPIKESLHIRKSLGGRLLLSARRRGITYQIYTTAEHAKFFTTGFGVRRKFRGGTVPHRIPSSGVMSDLGHPMTFHFKRFNQNWRVWTQIAVNGGNHPGIRLDSDFIRDAYAEVSPKITEIAKRHLVKAL